MARSKWKLAMLDWSKIQLYPHLHHRSSPTNRTGNAKVDCHVSRLHIWAFPLLHYLLAALLHTLVLSGWGTTLQPKFHPLGFCNNVNQKDAIEGRRPKRETHKTEQCMRVTKVIIKIRFQMHIKMGYRLYWFFLADDVHVSAKISLELSQHAHFTCYAALVACLTIH